MSSDRHAGALFAVVALLAVIAGCGGDSASSPAVERTVPASVDFFDADTGAFSHRILFEYNLPHGIDAHYLAPGEDGLWGTGDDISSPWLSCRYAEDITGLPYQRFLLLAAHLRSPSGAAALASTSQFDAVSPPCPTVDGHYLTQMDYCIGEHCPGGIASGYQLRITRTYDGDILIDSQTLDLIHGGVITNDMTRAQETRITLDELGRPEEISIQSTQTNAFDDILAGACEDGPSLAIAILLYRSCHAFRETARYHYDDAGIFREVDYYHGWNFSFLSHQQRLIDREAGLLSVSTRGSFTAPDAHQTEYLYGFNRHDQITTVTRRQPGEDGILYTDDDLVELRESYSYRSDGQPLGWQHWSGSSRQFHYGNSGRLRETQSYAGDETLLSVTRYRYADGRLRSSETLIPSADSAGDMTLTSWTLHRPAPEELASDFRPFRASGSYEPTLDAVLSRFDLP